MINDPVLLNDWHVGARVDDLAEDYLLPARLLGIEVFL